MGKRELLLILAFGVVGVLLYQVTAAPPAPNPNALTPRGVLDHLRRAVRGYRASAELERTLTQPVAAHTNELRLRMGGTATLNIQGEPRNDVEIHMKAWSNGYDDAEAQRLVKQTVDGLKVDQAGAILMAQVAYPEPGTQRATFTIKVPARLRVRLDQRASANISGVASVELGDSRGKSSIANVPGSVAGAHRGGELTIDNVGSVKLTSQNADIKLSGAKEVTLTARGGQVRAENVASVLEVESNNADVTLDRMAPTMSSLRMNVNGGTVAIHGLRADTRIDSRNAELRVVMERPAPVAIYSDGDERVEFTPPLSGGYKLDAIARNGRITPPEMVEKLGLTLAEDAENKEARLSGAVGAAGPTITLRTNGGDIVLKPRQLPTSQLPTSK